MENKGLLTFILLLLVAAIVCLFLQFNEVNRVKKYSEVLQTQLENTLNGKSEESPTAEPTEAAQETADATVETIAVEPAADDTALLTAQEEITRLQAEKDSLNAALADTENQLRLAQAERDALTQLLDVYQDLPSETAEANGNELTEVLLQQMAEIEAARSMAFTQLAELEAERDEALAQLADIRAERDDALTRLADAETERDAALAQLANGGETPETLPSPAEASEPMLTVGMPELLPIHDGAAWLTVLHDAEPDQRVRMRILENADLLGEVILTAPGETVDSVPLTAEPKGSEVTCEYAVLDKKGNEVTVMRFFMQTAE